MRYFHPPSTAITFSTSSSEFKLRLPDSLNSIPGVLLSRPNKKRSYRNNPALYFPSSTLRHQPFLLLPPRYFLMSFLLEPVTVEAGLAILSNRHLNRGTAFTEEQRRELKLVGLLPPRVETLEQQVERVWNQLCRYEKPINRYQHLASIHSTNTTLYYAVIMAHLEDLLPIIYTPTVGEACQNFSNYYIRERGVYLHRGIRGSFKEALENRRRNNVRVIVITDGSRILGLGDLVLLYVAGAGIHPSLVCPVVLDAGVNTERYLTDPQYFGTREKRFEDTEFYSMLDEFMEAAKVVWPSAVVQFEDFSNNHCFDMLERYQSKYRCFNDDIQGTGAVIAAGFLNAMRISGVSPLQQRTVVFGAGSAAVGVAKNIAQLAARLHKGVTYEDMLKTFYLVDTKGLVTTTRGDKLQAHKVLLAHTDVSAEDSAKLKTLEDVVDFVKPTALLGLGGVGPVFTEKIVKKVAANTPRPIIFPLSNPTSKAECIPADAYKWTDGKALIASGSPFPACTVNGKTLKPSQGNNLYVFPGIGLGSGLAQPATIPDEVLVAASASLYSQTTEEDLAAGQLYPPLDQIHKISANIAADVILEAQRLNVDGDKSLPTNRDEILAVEVGVGYGSWWWMWVAGELRLPGQQSSDKNGLLCVFLMAEGQKGGVLPVAFIVFSCFLFYPLSFIFVSFVPSSSTTGRRKIKEMQKKFIIIYYYYFIYLSLDFVLMFSFSVLLPGEAK
eukprot:gene7414-5221_t